jgi:hypothetical protein
VDEADDVDNKADVDIVNKKIKSEQYKISLSTTA